MLAGGRGDGIGTEEPDLASGGEDCSSRAEGHGLIERLARDGAIILGRVEHPIGMAKYQMRCLDPARRREPHPGRGVAGGTGLGPLLINGPNDVSTHDLQPTLPEHGHENAQRTQRHHYQ